MANKRTGIYFTEEVVKLPRELVKTYDDGSHAENKVFQKVNKKLYG